MPQASQGRALRPQPRQGDHPRTQDLDRRDQRPLPLRSSPATLAGRMTSSKTAPPNPSTKQPPSKPL
eukprot:5898854-Prymnesium_polylepis.1